jgi:hypothetical protein
VAARKSFLLRLPPELHAALEKWAADELRSVNGQIEYLLATAVREAGRAPKRTQGGDAPPDTDSSPS